MPNRNEMMAMAENVRRMLLDRIDGDRMIGSLLNIAM